MSQVLHEIEKKIITSLRETSKQTMQKLENTTNLSSDQIRRGIEWLRLKNLANVQETKIITYSLGRNGLDAFENGLPERRLVNLVTEGSKKYQTYKKNLAQFLAQQWV